MRDRFFLDTNVLVYSFDAASPSKQKRSMDLIKEGLDSHKGVISLQVVQEFLNVALRKFSNPLTIPDAQTYLKEVLSPLCESFPDIRLVERALNLFKEYGFSFYDSLIVASALESECRVLYSEDFQNGLRVETMRIENPYT